MKLSESQIRNLVREELKAVLEEGALRRVADAVKAGSEWMGSYDPPYHSHYKGNVPIAPNPFDKKALAMSGVASLSAGALVKLLQANPDLMEKVQQFLQSLMQEE